MLTGAGKGFCAGGDIGGMQQRACGAARARSASTAGARQQRTHHAVSLLHTMPKPTIAAVNGAATGLGADMALAATSSSPRESRASPELHRCAA